MYDVYVCMYVCMYVDLYVCISGVTILENHESIIESVEKWKSIIASFLTTTIDNRGLIIDD